MRGDRILELDENVYVAYLNEHKLLVQNNSSQSDEMRCIEESQFDRYDDERYYSYYHHETEGYIVIEVIDSGIGISEDGQQKLFHPFSQADRSIQKTFGGTGLGLWLSQSIIKLFNGKITIDS